MTDSAIRQHERSDDPTEQVRWLAELHRVEPWRVEVAAYCGHEGAQAVLGEWAPHIPGCSTFMGSGIGTTVARWKDITGGIDPHWTFDRWIRGLERWEGALQRAAVAYGCVITEVEEITINHLVACAGCHASSDGEQATLESIQAALVKWALHG